MTNNGTMPAMPCEVVEQYHIEESQAPKGAPTPRERKVMSSGMTKREIMAMNIASGIIASGYDATFEATAGCAVRYTDALLAELERTK
ncbi:hypothetical protein 4L372X_027 [Aeromonas phage 4_L372X]|nr:hypothetical protein 4L372X_027 [Aeromonas phage 4_L372X]